MNISLYNFENLKLKSLSDFNLMGIRLPKIFDIENIEAKIYKDNFLIGKITEIKNYKNLSIGYF